MSCGGHARPDAGQPRLDGRGADDDDRLRPAARTIDTFATFTFSSNDADGDLRVRARQRALRLLRVAVPADQPRCPASTRCASARRTSPAASTRPRPATRGRSRLRRRRRSSTSRRTRPTSQTATFTFSSDKQGVTFECALDEAVDDEVFSPLHVAQDLHRADLRLARLRRPGEGRRRQRRPDPGRVQLGRRDPRPAGRRSTSAPAGEDGQPRARRSSSRRTSPATSCLRVRADHADRRRHVLALHVAEDVQRAAVRPLPVRGPRARARRGRRAADHDVRVDGDGDGSARDDDRLRPDEPDRPARRRRFALESDEPGATFECKLDAAAASRRARSRPSSPAWRTARTRSSSARSIRPGTSTRRRPATTWTVDGDRTAPTTRSSSGPTR